MDWSTIDNAAMDQQWLKFGEHVGCLSFRMYDCVALICNNYGYKNARDVEAIADGLSTIKHVLDESLLTYYIYVRRHNIIADEYMPNTKIRMIEVVYGDKPYVSQYKCVKRKRSELSRQLSPQEVTFVDACLSDTIGVIAEIDLNIDFFFPARIQHIRDLYNKRKQTIMECLRKVHAEYVMNAS